MTDKLWLFVLEYLLDIFLKIKEMSLSLKGNNRQYLLLMITFKISSKNENFRKLLSTTVSLKILGCKGFADKIVGDNNYCDFFFLWYWGLNSGPIP
jgi:hypothetical protein